MSVKSNRNQLLSPRQIEGLISQGQIVVIYDGYALKLDSWLYKHPGGQLAIQHMVGRDATDEINVYHLPKTQRLMTAYRIGKVDLPWVNLIPPLHGGVHRPYSDASDSLQVEKVEDDGSDWSSGETAVGWSSSVSTTTEQERLSVEPDDAKCPACVVEGIEGEKCHALDKTMSCSPTRKMLSVQAYTSMLEAREVAEAIKEYPSLDLETQQNISKEYRALHQQIIDQGYYKCNYSAYGKDSIRFGILFGCFLALLYAKWYLTSAVFLGMFWQQFMFIAHDAGHRGITGNFVTDTLIGAFVADFCCGLSIGWWKSSHNVHHLVTNMPEHDPDLQNTPLFATGPSYLRNLKSTFYNFMFAWSPDKADAMITQYQKWAYYPIMGLARFNLYILSWLHIMSPRAQNLGSASWTRPVEIAFMACYWFWFGYLLVALTLPDWPTRIAFVLLSHGCTMLLHVQITLSHWGMPTSTLGPMESFAQHQLRTTMDVDCPAWLDFLHGGLQFQAVHHLFPRVPRHNLRALQTMVREFCDKTEIEYKCYGFVHGNKIVLSRLEEVAKMAETLVQCQKYMAETGESGLH